MTMNVPDDNSTVPGNASDASYFVGNTSDIFLTVQLLANSSFTPLPRTNSTSALNHTRTTTTSFPDAATDTLENGFKSHDALLYIVVVLLFYALSMVILMIKYIRREREEAEMANYYAEYVSREKFRTPRYEIQNYMRKLKLGPFHQPTVKEKSTDDEDYVSCLEVPLVCTNTACNVTHSVTMKTSTVT